MLLIMLTDAAAIDKLFYTASLATNPRDIDPLLDRMRVMTSRPGYKPEMLTDNERAVVTELQAELEQYLVTKEPLRSFTPQSLQLQITQHMEGNVGSSSKRQLIVVLVVAFVVALGAAVLLPLADPQQRGQVGGSVAFSLVNVGAAWLFVTALRAFKSSLRQAFVLICSGVTLIGVSLVSHPIVEVYQLRSYPLTSLLLPLPLLAAAIIFYAGNVRYARLVGVIGRSVAVWPVLLAGLVLSIVTWLLPHQAVNEPEIVFDAAAIMWGIMLLMPVASTFVLPKVVRQLPELYKPPARALAASMWGIIAVVGYQFVLRVVAGPYMSGPVAYGLFALVVVMGLMLLRAGYAFNKVSQY